MEPCTLSVPVTLQSDMPCTSRRNLAVRYTTACQSVTDPDVIVFHFHKGLSLKSRLQWQATNSPAIIILAGIVCPANWANCYPQSDCIKITDFKEPLYCVNIC